MIKRIVRMKFKPGCESSFIDIFQRSALAIRSFKGCHHVELLNDINDPLVFTTLSFWETEEALELYRSSELFRSTWAKTKLLFDEKPQANSYSYIEILD